MSPNDKSNETKPKSTRQTWQKPTLVDLNDVESTTHKRDAQVETARWKGPISTSPGTTS